MKCFSQKVDLSEEQLIVTLCKNWKLDYELHDGKLSSITNNPILRSYFLEFKADYTFISIINGTKTIGSWCYNVKNKNVELTLHEQNELRIFSIEENSLIMVLRSQIGRNQITLPKTHSKYSLK